MDTDIQTSSNSSTSDEELQHSRRYEILVSRLGRFLKKNPQFTEDEDEDEDTPWCYCKQGDLGTVSVRCDAPGCHIRWYHKECLPYRDQLLVDEFDLWICPNCLMHQLVDLIKEQRSFTGTSHQGDEIDEVVKQEIDMAVVDARLRRSGRWIFKDSSKNTPRHQRSGKTRIRSDTQLFHPHQGTALSLIAAVTAPTIIPEVPSQSDKPVQGTWGASLSVMAKLTMSVSNFDSLQTSARIWTCEATQVTVTAEESLSVEYKHDYWIPKATDDLDNCPRFLLKCTSVRGGNDAIEVPLDLLLAFSLNLQQMTREISAKPPPRRLLGTIHLKHVDMAVLISALEFLKGETLSIILPGTKTSLTVGQKLVIIQYTHLAHTLSIQPLQNAAMHALCASILRRPKDWSDTWAIADLMNEMTTEGNPARRVLFDGPNCLLPNKDRKQLPCGVVARNIICMNRRVKAMWKPRATTPAEYAEDDDSMDVDSDDEMEEEGGDMRKNEDEDEEQADDDMDEDGGEYEYEGDDEETEEDSDP